MEKFSTVLGLAITEELTTMVDVISPTVASKALAILSKKKKKRALLCRVELLAKLVGDGTEGM